MLEVSIPGRGNLVLHYVVFDVNGTLATDGILTDGVAERLKALGELLEIHMLTADTHGKQGEIDAQLGMKADRVTGGLEKAKFVNELGAEHVVAIGNGGNDVGMLQTAEVGIVVLGAEGLNVEALQAADIVVSSILDGLDLLLKPKRLVATLRR